MSSRRVNDQAGRTLDEVLDAEAQTRAPDRLLESVFAQTTATRQARRRPWDRARRGPGTRPVGPLLVVAAFVVGGSALFLVTGAGRPPAVTPTDAPSGGLAGVAVADVCASGRGLAGSATTLWAGCPTGIRRIDIAVDPPSVGPLIEGIGRPVAGPAEMWATTIGGIVPIDPVAGPGQVVPANGVMALGAGGHGPWVGTADGLEKVDPATGRVLGTVTLGAEPLAIVEAGDRVWVTANDGTLHSYDAASLAPDPVITVGGSPIRMASDGSAVYVASQGRDGTVTRVDAATRAVTRRMVAQQTDPDSLGEIVATADGVWVTRRAALLRLDPATLEVLSVTPLPGYPLGIVVDGGTAWALSDEGHLDRAPLR